MYTIIAYSRETRRPTFCVGRFKSRKEAEDYADGKFRDGSWKIVPLFEACDMAKAS